MAELDKNFLSLLHQVSEGSEEAARELVDNYGDTILRAVRRALDDRLRCQFDSLDFVQCVWKSFFARRGATDRFRTPQELIAFLVVMARNKVGEQHRFRATQKRDFGRELSLDARRNKPVAQKLFAPQPGPPAAAIAQERWENLTQECPHGYEKILELKLQGHTQEEIAGALGYAVATVRRFLKRLAHENAS